MAKTQSRSNLLAFGRRTRVNVIGGKNIRRLRDGTEMFEDYWTDSEEDDNSIHVSKSSGSSNVKVPEKLDSGLATESNTLSNRNQESSKKKISFSSQLNESNVNYTSVKGNAKNDVTVSSPVTRSKHISHDSQISSPNKRHDSQINYTKKGHKSQSRVTIQSPITSKITHSNTKSKDESVKKNLINSFPKSPEKVSNCCQTPDHNAKSVKSQSILDLYSKKSDQGPVVGAASASLDSGHDLDENFEQSSKLKRNAKETSSEVSNMKEIKTHRKNKWLIKSNVNSKKSVNETKNTVITSKSISVSPENFQFRKNRSRTIVLRSDTEDEYSDKESNYIEKNPKTSNNDKKYHNFKTSKIPVKLPSHSTKVFNVNKTSGNAKNSQISETVVDEAVTIPRKKTKHKRVHLNRDKNLKRKKQMNSKVQRVKNRISAPDVSNNKNLSGDSNAGDISEETSEPCSKKLSVVEKPERKSYLLRSPNKDPALSLDHNSGALGSENAHLQRENLHKSKISDECVSQNSKHKDSENEEQVKTDVSRRSKRIRFRPLDHWKNERIQYQFLANGGIAVLGVQREGDYLPVNKEKISVSEKKVEKLPKKQAQKKQVRTAEFDNKMENKDVKKIPIIDVESGEEVEANVIRPFTSLEWNFPGTIDEETGNYSVAKSFDSPYSSFGFLNIYPHCNKPVQFIPDEDIHFVLIKGKVKVEVHMSQFMLKKGGSFIVPHGNAYGIFNEQNSHAILTFSTFKYSLLNSIDS